MKLAYHEIPRIRIERVQPTKDNSCRLSVLANAINHFSGRALTTPDSILTLIDQWRTEMGLPQVDLDTEAILDEEVVLAVKALGEGVGYASAEGARFVNFSLWGELIREGCLIAPDHQMIYTAPPDYKVADLSHYPPNLLSRAIYDDHFSYRTFRELYDPHILRTGHFEDGHFDLVVDVTTVNGLPVIVFANFGTGGTDYPYFLPWDFFRNYLFFDWSGPVIHNPTELPDEEAMKELFETGTLDFANRFFFYASMEIYYPKSRQQQLDAILAKYV